MPKRLRVLDIDVPDEFPAEAYDAVYASSQDGRETRKDLATEARGGWNALAFRFLACRDHATAFSQSVSMHGNMPAMSARVEQERELFNFFTNGLAAIESFYYSVHAIAGMIDPTEFPMSAGKRKRAVTPEKTTKRFEAKFPGDPLSVALRLVLDDQGYERWDSVRNVLAHRVVLGRHARLTTNDTLPGTAKYAPVEVADGTEDIIIDDNTTKTRLGWLSGTLTTLVTQAEAFVTQHDSVLHPQ